MAVFAAVFSHAADGWTGTEVDLAEYEGIDDLADRMRDTAAAESTAETSVVVLAEADDEWFGVARLDDTGEPRAFLSDMRVVYGHPAARLFLETDGGIDDDQETEGTGQNPYPEPVGDPDLLDDLGIPGTELMALTTREGILPADALTTIADRAGFAGELDELRA